MSEAISCAESSAVQMGWVQKLLDHGEWVQRSAGPLCEQLGLCEVVDPGPEATRWGLYERGGIGALFVRVPHGHAFACGNGSMNRVISISGHPVRFSSSRRCETLYPRDRIWVPEGEAYLLEPLGLKVEAELVMWPLPRAVPFNFLRS
jgi:hypothetical protein